MRIMKTTMAAIVALSVVGTPAVAATAGSNQAVAANPAAKLSLNGVARTGARTKAKNKAAGGFIVPALAIIAIGAGAAAALSGNDDPASP